MALIGDDCRWFYTSQCRNGDNCLFRHCEEALGSTAVCPSWLKGGCYLPHCPYRHAHIVEKASQPWDEFGSWNRVSKPAAQPARSSLVAVPIVGGTEPPVVTGQPAYHVVNPDLPLYHPYGDVGSYDDSQYGSSPADVVGQASVIITPRHDELFPPQVKPVVVRLGSNGGIHILDDLKWRAHADHCLKKGQQRLYFLRRLRSFAMPTVVMLNFYRAVIENSSDSDDSEAGRSNLTTLRRVDTLNTAVVNSAEPEESPRLVIEKEKTEAPVDDIPPERQAVKKEDAPVTEKVEESDGSSDYEEGSSEEREAEAEDDGVEEEEDSADEDKSGSEDSRSSSDEKSESSGATTASKEAELEPELDLFDEDDADFLGVVEKTPIALKEKRRKAESRRASNEDRLQERRERRESRRRSRSPLRPTRRHGNASSARHLVRRDKNERKKAIEKPSVEEKKESVEVLSLEEIMRQKALQSMVERRKQKEEAEKVKQGAAVGTDTPRTYTPELARRDSPKRPNSRNERRWSPVQRDRPTYGRSRSPTARRRSPPLPLADSSRWRSRPKRGDYPPYSDYDARWRRYDDDIRSDARQLSLLQAQSDLMDKIARVASGSGSAHMLSERDLKRQQKLPKRQLKHLSKRLETASGSDSRSSSVCTTCSDTSSADERRRRKQKAKKSKRKKSKKSRRKSAERYEENENRVEADYVEYEDDGEYNDEQTSVPSPKSSELEIAPPNVLPRAKVVIKLDDESKSLNISGADLLSRKDDAAKENKLEPVPVLPGRKIQLKKTMKTAAEVEKSKAKVAIADRLAAKKADDEATKLMLAKIRESAIKETRKIVMGLLIASAAGTGASKLHRTRKISEETDILKVVASQPGRVVQLASKLKPGSERTSPTTDDVNSKSPPSSFESDVLNKRRIIRRQPVQVYVPPSVKRKADGDHNALPSNDIRSRSDKMRDEAKTQRALTPEPAASAPAESTNSAVRRATVADIRTSGSAGDVASTKFELGVKTFAQIMREKKERKALEDKRRLADAEQQSTKLKINRPSVMDRLSLPKEIAETKSTFKATPTAGPRTIEKYEVDWLEENSVDRSAQTEDGLLRVTHKRRNNLASNAGAAVLMKRARTEPARQLSAISVPLKSKSEALATQKDEKRIRTNFVRDEDDFLLLDDSPTDTTSGLSSIDNVPMRAVEKPSSSSETAKARASSERKSMSNAEWDEISLLLDDEVGNVPEKALPTPPKNAVDVADDDELLLQELDELLG